MSDKRTVTAALLGAAGFTAVAAFVIWFIVAGHWTRLPAWILLPLAILLAAAVIGMPIYGLARWSDRRFQQRRKP